MTDLETLMKALDSAHWELSEAFKGLPDEDVWKRPHPRLLSVGEQAAHIAYWEAQSFFGDTFKSPLTASAASYYTSNVEEPFELAMGAEAVFAEVSRIHQACKTSFAAEPHAFEDVNSHRGTWTWGATIEYQVFHVAYHTGQIYSVRHLLGHETVDN